MARFQTLLIKRGAVTPVLACPLGLLLGSVLFLQPPGVAQLIPDDTTGTQIQSGAEVQGLPSDLVEGGAVRNSNLFHSFQEFNVDVGRGVYFTTLDGITNILTRVTGSNVSNIDGTLGVLGNANLFLINPNGIIFGPGARLDLNGSFVGSTAESIFFDNYEFSATPTGNELLVVSVPLGVQFNNPPQGDISSAGILETGRNLTLLGSNLSLEGQLLAGQDLLLLGQEAVTIRDTATEAFVASAGGDLTIQGNQLVDIFALTHPDSGLFSGGDLGLRSDNSVIGDAHFYSSGSFWVETLDGTAGNLLSPTGPVILASGNVSLGNYTGASLHMLAGGSVTLRRVTINNAGPVGSTISPSNTTLFSGGYSIADLATFNLTEYETTFNANGYVRSVDPTLAPITIDGSAQATLDVRAGVDWAALGGLPTNPLQLSSVASLNTVGGRPTRADITITDNIRINSPTGLVLLTNQFSPNTLVGTITAEGKPTRPLRIHTGTNLANAAGGDIRVYGRGDIVINNANITSNTFSNVANSGAGGSVSFSTHMGKISFTDSTLNAASVSTAGSAGAGGAVSLSTNTGDISLTGSRLNTPSVSAASANSDNSDNTEAGGPVSLSTNTGDISFTGSKLNTASVSTAPNNSGNTEAGGPVSFSTNTGDISIAGSKLNTASVSTGFVTSGSTEAGGSVSFSTNTGDISLTDTPLDLTSFSRSGNAGPGGDLSFSTHTGNISLTNSDSDAVSISNSTVVSSTADTGGAITFSTDIGNISLFNSDVASISFAKSGTAGNAGPITLSTDTGNIFLTDSISNAASVSNLGEAGNGGTISFNTHKGDISLVNAGSTSTSFSSLGDVGNGGAISFNTDMGNISLINSDLDALSFSELGPAGTGGEIALKAPEGSIQGGNSEIFTLSVAESSGQVSGNGGAVTLEARDTISGLEVNTLSSDGVSGEVRIQGQGDLIIQAVDLITSPQVEFFTFSRTVTIDTSGFGQSGNAFISSTGNLTFKDVQILSNSNGPNAAGNVTLVSSGEITLIDSRINSNTNSIGAAGNIQIESDTGILLTGPEVSLEAISNADGNAGSINLDAPNITVEQGAEISTVTTADGSAGDIRLDAKTFTLSNGSEILAASSGAGNGGEIIVNASTAVNLGEGVQDFAPIISVETSGAGRAGDITINTPTFTLSETARITATATETATNTEIGGSITLNTSDMDLAGVVGIFAETEGQAPAGTLTLQPFEVNFGLGAPQLDPQLNITLASGAEISASTSGAGQGGGLQVFAPEAITIAGPGQLAVETLGAGDGGDIEIRTRQLTLTDGVEVSASTFEVDTITGFLEPGDAGDIIIFADDFNLTNGATLQTNTAGIGDAGTIALTINDTLSLDQGAIAANTGDTSTGAGGNIEINAGITQLSNSSLTVNSQGQGVGGDILVMGDSLLLDQGSAIDAATDSSDGGNIRLTLEDVLLLSDQSEITATAGSDGGEGDGGNIDINAEFVIAAPAGLNRITANAFEGDGGNINITTTALLGEQFLEIEASSRFGLEGSITIDSPNLDPANSIVELPTDLVDASTLIADACFVDSSQQRSQFVATGRGGLPTRPTSYPTGAFLLPDLGPLATAPPDSQTTGLREAQSWSVAANGDIVLFANPATLLNRLLWEARQAYGRADYAEAATLWGEAVETLAQGNDPLAYASTLSNLALAHHHLGQWEQAQSAIAATQQVLTPEMATTYPWLAAQTFNTQASLQLARGDAQAALNDWRHAADAYEQAGNQGGQLRVLLNQTQAWQALGFYPRAEAQLETIVTALAEQPPSSVQAMTLLNLGNVLRARGETGRSQHTLEAALAMTQPLNQPTLSSAILLNLGHTARAQAQPDQALAYYQAAMTTAPAPLTQFQAQVSQLGLLATQNPEAAATLWSALEPTLQQQTTALPAGREAIYAQLHLAETLLQTDVSLASPDQIMVLLMTAGQQAQTLQDPIAQAYTVSYQAQVYGKAQHWAEAQSLTEQALRQARSLQAPEMIYQWAWQLGQVHQAHGDRSGAIAAYTEAVNALSTLRSDLIASSDDVQFTFRDTVEPVYRDLVKLLLQGDAGQPVDPANLTQARTLIENLQLAELQDYFQDDCVQAIPIIADEVDPAAAVIYPILLDDRLDVIVSVAGQPMRHHSTPISSAQVEQTVNQLLGTLTTALGSGQASTTQQLQQVYDWIMAPVAADLAQQSIETLVFVADGALRTLPLTALHDGEQYLIEQYNVVLSPGLDLLDPRPLERQGLQMLAGGLSESRPGFPPLPFVADEIQQITAQIPNHQVLLNQNLTKENLTDSLTTAPAEVIHLATHGTFGASAEETFILTWEGELTIKELGALLQARNRSGAPPIELLVFSACRTAAGDSRAVLGIAGMAIRSGVRSTLAGLWPLNDQATAVFMNHFYEALAQPEVTKAEAFRQAQLALMQDPQFRTPYYWSPFVMMGNWL